MSEADEEVNISEFVGKINEQLTEGVSNFQLYVLNKRDREDPIEPGLSGQVVAVAQQCDVIVGVTRQMADEHEEFDDIRARLLSQAAGLESAGKNFLLISNSLAGRSESNKDQWQRLADGLAAVAEHLMNLMGALYRLDADKMAAAQAKLTKALDDTKQTSVASLTAKPDEFASQASMMGAQASHMAHTLVTSSDPETRDLGEKLQQRAEEIVKSANRCLEEMSEESVAEFNQVSETLLADASKAHQLTVERLAISPIETMDEESPLPATESTKPALPARDWKPQSMDEVSKFADSFAKSVDGANGIDVQALAQLIALLAKAAKMGKGNELLKNAREISAISIKYSNELKALAKTTEDPMSRKRLLIASDQLKDFSQQLKILASVKASVSKRNIDRDEQLISVTANLVKTWKEGTSATVMSKLKRK